ncbi:hypothetical protein B0T20DRAFT_204107 [Sordaria brevicollis]|uniref:Uncharacterized protein n=1 Tax=Sordaria brevicollis TaxID=83679 RepID=A0AAE0UBQ5_SORBR|nr:hypothetical protein B0T20DRAFT_204107 [Sordaria brevicollis]
MAMASARCPPLQVASNLLTGGLAGQGRRRSCSSWFPARSGFISSSRECRLPNEPRNSASVTSLVYLGKLETILLIKKVVSDLGYRQDEKEDSRCILYFSYVSLQAIYFQQLNFEAKVPHLSSQMFDMYMSLGKSDIPISAHGTELSITS